jgi:thiol-disulfide isomerase/thioredoxin
MTAPERKEADRHEPAGIRGQCSASVAGPLLALAVVASAFAAPKAGDAAPDFAGRTDEGEAISLAAYSGKVVVLSFWAAWCGPCRKELPLLEGIQQVAGKDRVQVVASNIEDRDTFRKIAPKMKPLQMLVASDTARQAQEANGVNGIPHMVIIGTSGRIVRVRRGYSEAGVDLVVEDLNKALAQ